MCMQAPADQVHDSVESRYSLVIDSFRYRPDTEQEPSRYRADTEQIPGMTAGGKEGKKWKVNKDYITNYYIDATLN